MPALETVGAYLKESRVLLQDTRVPYRYSDAELVDCLNTGILEARRLRADLFLPTFTIPYFDTSGTINSTAKVAIDPMYRPAFLYYIVGKAQLRDEESTTDQRASAFLTKFTSQLLTIAS
jgi:hypothetical protein